MGLPPPDAEEVALRTAKSWGKDPTQWDRLSPDAQARMIVHDIIAGARESYELKHGEKNKGDKDKPDKGGSSGGAFDRMRARVGLGQSG
jgi:hypothetical protein